MSNSNRQQIGLVEESTFGEIPTSPAFETVRITQGGPQYTPKTVTSNEIRADRQVTDLILVGEEASAVINFELSYGAQDTLFEAALCSDWVNKPVILNVTSDSNITNVDDATDTFTVLSALGTPFKVGHLARTTGFTNSANNQIFRVTSSTATTIVGSSLTLTNETAPPAGAKIQVVGFQGAAADITATTVSGNALLSTVLDFTTLGLVVGEWVKVGGTATGDKFATAALNDWCRISAIAAGRLSFDVVPTGWAIDTGTGKTIKVWAGDYIRNGVVEHSYSIERQFQDHSPVTYQYGKGMEIDEFVIEYAAESIITGRATFVGKNATLQDSGRVSGATDVAAPTNPVLNTASNVGRIGEGGSAVGTPNYVMSGSITIRNNLRRRTAVSVLGAASIGQGEFNANYRANTYFGNSDLADKVTNNTQTSHDFRVRRSDTNGQAILFDLPAAKYSRGGPDTPGKNADVMVDLEGQAFMHATLGYTTQFQRFVYTE